MSKAKNIVAMIGSLLLAFLLWAYVVTFVNTVVDVAVSNIPIRILNADSLTNNGYILTGVSHTTTTVTVSGSRSDTAAISADEILVTLDVGGYAEGENTIRVNVSAPSNVTVKDIRNNGRVTAYIDQLITETKPYEFLYSGTVPSGYEMGFVTYKPESVTVSGAKAIVDQVQKLHVILNLSQLTRNGYTFESTITPVSDTGNEVKNVTLSEQSLVGTAYLCEVADVPVLVKTEGEIPEGYIVETEGEPALRLRAALVDLASIEAVQSEPVDASLLTEEGMDVPLSFVLPDGTEYAEGAGPITVRLKLVQAEDGENAGEAEDAENTDPNAALKQ